MKKQIRNVNSIDLAPQHLDGRPGDVINASGPVRRGPGGSGGPGRGDSSDFGGGGSSGGSGGGGGGASGGSGGGSGTGSGTGDGGFRGKKMTTCSFCGKTSREVGAMVEGPGDVYICANCTDLCQNIFKQEKRRVASLGRCSPPFPRRVRSRNS